MRLRVRKLARAEVDTAFNWYFERSPRAAERFLEAVNAAIKGIESAPKRQPVIRGRLRRLLLKGFPYGVYYKVYLNVISVVGVIHGRRHPAAWLVRT